MRHTRFAYTNVNISQSVQNNVTGCGGLYEKEVPNAFAFDIILLLLDIIASAAAAAKVKAM